jgi:acyl-CoA thioester hydrolase
MLASYEVVSMKTHTTDEIVRYIETDQMKVAHHTTYLVWFESGRTSLLDSAGYPYKTMEEDGVFLPVVDFSCRITGSSGYNDRLRIETWVEELRSRAITFGYQVWKDGKSIATGRTKHICVDEHNRLKRIPIEITETLGLFAKKHS